MASISYRSEAPSPLSSIKAFIDKLNGPWHKQALWVFFVIVLAHWAEHVFQAHQIYILGMARPAAKGALGMVWPWLVSSEWLHYGYALVMLAGLIILRPGFVGRARARWNLALGIQVWHHFEHLLLLVQAITGVFLFGGKVPTSVFQALVPANRVELHLFYNAIVFIPMVIAMVYHFKPPASDKEKATCNCARAKLVDVAA
jgi:hypothetical protein